MPPTIERPAMLSVDAARARLAKLAGRLPAAAVDLAAAAGLVLAEDVLAPWDLPAFDNSAMDGFAVRAEDLAGASGGNKVRLRLIGEVAAGSVFPGRVEPGTAVRIMTGAPIPAGADAVIEVEETEVDGDGVLVARAPEPGRSFRLAGTDVRAGEAAMLAGAHLGPSQVALLAALGVARPVCVARPRVAVLATGDELVDVGTEPGPGQVVNIVTPALSAAVRDAGATALPIRAARDTVEDLRRAFAEAVDADLILSVGGVSMGEYDLVRGVVEELGDLDFWRVAMRPGRPLAVGRVGGKPFIGLPGNPVSALVGFEVYVLPALMAMSGRPSWGRPTVAAELAQPVTAPEGLRTFARARLEPRPGQTPLAYPAPGQASFQLRSLASSNALLDLPETGGRLEPGAVVTAIALDRAPGPPS